MLTPDAIEITFDHALDGVDRTHLCTLISDLFANQPAVARVQVQALPGSSAGLSSLSLVLAHPITADGAQYCPMVIRIGQAEAIQAEYKNYTQYVEPFTKSERAQLHHTSRYGSLAAMSYTYLGSVKQPIQTLRDNLWQQPDQLRALAAIRNLFSDTLVGSGQNGWHTNARLFADQRPGWFYNRVLPPVLSLRDVRVQCGNVNAAEVRHLLAYADQPQAYHLVGQRVSVGCCAEYPKMQVVEQQTMKDGQVRLRLHLLANHPVPTTGIYRPLDPIAARLELIVPGAQVAQVRADLELGAAFEGRVVSTRYTMLADQIRSYGLQQVENLLGQELGDPLAIYGTLFDTPMHLHTSIIHGDLNLGNILMREYPSNGMVAWLIDFDQTRPGGHTVFDLVKLETEYKLHILTHRLRSRNEVLRLEAALHAALTKPSEVERYLAGNRELVRAYEFILGLRQLALNPSQGTHPYPYEYYVGLIGYGLAALKYRNLYEQGRERWVQPQAQIEPLASVAYLSAAYAASVIDQTWEFKAWPSPVRGSPRTQRSCRAGITHPLYHHCLRRSSIGGS